MFKTWHISFIYVWVFYHVAWKYIINTQLLMTSLSPMNTTLVTFGVYCKMLHVAIVGYVTTFDVILKVVCPLRFVTCTCTLKVTLKKIIHVTCNEQWTTLNICCKKLSGLVWHVWWVQCHVFIVAIFIVTCGL